MLVASTFRGRALAGLSVLSFVVVAACSSDPVGEKPSPVGNDGGMVSPSPVVDGAGPTIDAPAVPAPRDAGEIDAGDTFVATPESCLTNCNHPACTALVACVDVVPGGWQGPLALYEKEGAEAPPACSDGDTESFVGGSNPSTGLWECLVSSCQSRGNGQCDAGNVLLLVAPPRFPELQPQWQTQARGCVPAALPTTRSCGMGKVCIPRPASPFLPRTCIASDAGSVPCPPGTFTERHEVGRAMEDTRGCGAGGCAAPPGGVLCVIGGAPKTGGVAAKDIVTVCCAP